MTQTSARHRAFNFQRGTSDDTETSALEPVSFELDNQLIRCVDDVDGMQLLLFTATMGAGFTGPQRAQSMTDFLKKAIVPEDYDLFLKACASSGIEIEDVGSICGWLADAYSERPTKSAQRSSAGQTTTGSSSEASSPSEESTGDDSQPQTSSQ